MPDDGHRYELLDGTLVVSPAVVSPGPGRVHQRAVTRSIGRLDAVIARELEVLAAPFAVRPEGHLPPQDQAEFVTHRRFPFTRRPADLVRRRA